MSCYHHLVPFSSTNQSYSLSISSSQKKCATDVVMKMMESLILLWIWVHSIDSIRHRIGASLDVIHLVLALQISNFGLLNWSDRILSYGNETTSKQMWSQILDAIDECIDLKFHQSPQRWLLDKTCETNTHGSPLPSCTHCIRTQLAFMLASVRWLTRSWLFIFADLAKRSFK